VTTTRTVIARVLVSKAACVSMIDARPHAFGDVHSKSVIAEHAEGRGRGGNPDWMYWNDSTSGRAAGAGLASRGCRSIASESNEIDLGVPPPSALSAIRLFQ
jgi:hypothetical protein